MAGDRAGAFPVEGAFSTELGFRRPDAGIRDLWEKKDLSEILPMSCSDDRRGARRPGLYPHLGPWRGINPAGRGPQAAPLPGPTLEYFCCRSFWAAGLFAVFGWIFLQR